MSWSPAHTLFLCFFKNGVGGRAQCCKLHSFGVDLTGVRMDEGKTRRHLFREVGVGHATHPSEDPPKPGNAVQLFIYLHGGGRFVVWG